jgi:DNA-nicking Smr family endonuclease
MRRRTELSPEDAELFRREIGPINPMQHDRADLDAALPSPLPRQTWREQRQVPKELLSGDFDPTELETGDELVYLRPGLQRNILRKLRRGHYSVHRELDLHGYTVPQAHETLAAFLYNARLHDERCVRIVHGKGINSRNQQPILKGKLNIWLRQRDEVLAFCSARPVDGGTGAVYVLLAKS